MRHNFVGSTVTGVLTYVTFHSESPFLKSKHLCVLLSLSLSLRVVIVDNRLCHRDALAFISINIKVSFNLLSNEKLSIGLEAFLLSMVLTFSF
jgi:hypothetical protein